MAKRLYVGVSEQSKAAQHRWDDAQALLAACRWRGAMYLAGYVIECLLKAKLMQMFGSRNLNELEQELQRRGILSAAATVYSHQLESLLRLAGWDRIRRDAVMRRASALANQWLPAWRYTADLSDAREAGRFLSSVDAVRHWVEHNI